MKTILWLGIIALGCARAQALDVTQGATNITISATGKPVLVYRHAGYPFKPYAAQLYSPAGVAVLRDSPADHKHHHGLMFALEVNGVNFWEEIPQSGHQIQRTLDVSDGVITQQLDWQTAAGKSVLRETRILQPHTDSNATLLTWQNRLETPADTEAVTLTGHHYFGLGMRFITSMDKVGTFLNASGRPGEVVRGTERLVPATWCAYTAPAGGKPVTVALFDHPDNLRYPARMFTMSQPFAYLSATLNLWKEPFVLKTGQPLELRYGIAVWDGQADVQQIEQTYHHWLKLTPKLRPRP